MTDRPNRRRVVILVCAILVVAVLSAGLIESLPRRGDWMVDLEAYLRAVHRFLDGKPLYRALTTNGPFSPGRDGPYLYLYAPPFALTLLPLTVTGQATIPIWLVLHQLALLVACSLMPIRPGLRVAVAIVGMCSAPVLRDAALGNVSLFVLLAAIIGWRWLDRPLGSIAIGLSMTVRATFAVFLIWWLVRARWQAAAWALGALVVAMALALPVVGLHTYLDYLQSLRNLSDLSGDPYNKAMAAILRRNGVDPGLADAAQFAIYALVGLAMIASLRRDRELGYVVTVGATMNLAPLLWQHYTVLLLIPAAFLSQRGKPLALMLPLLGWLPEAAQPMLALGAVILPFLAGSARDPAEREPAILRPTPPDMSGSESVARAGCVLR